MTDHDAPSPSQAVSEAAPGDIVARMKNCIHGEPEHIENIPMILQLACAEIEQLRAAPPQSPPVEVVDREYYEGVIVELREEVSALKHDIERHIAKVTELEAVLDNSPEPNEALRKLMALPRDERQ